MTIPFRKLDTKNKKTQTKYSVHTIRSLCQIFKHDSCFSVFCHWHETSWHKSLMLQRTHTHINILYFYKMITCKNVTTDVQISSVNMQIKFQIGTGRPSNRLNDWHKNQIHYIQTHSKSEFAMQNAQKLFQSLLWITKKDHKKKTTASEKINNWMTLKQSVWQFYGPSFIQNLSTLLLSAYTHLKVRKRIGIGPKILKHAENLCFNIHAIWVQETPVSSMEKKSSPNWYKSCIF